MDLQPIFTVSELNQALNVHLALLGEVCVEGEISRIQVRNNHLLFITIKDACSSLDVFALTYQISGFGGLQEGMLVKVAATPGLYKGSGKFRLQATAITPSGEGALRAAYENLKAKLAKEGLFDLERKRPLPKFPQSVGLITAPDSQAYKDFVKVAASRFSAVTLYFAPATVQGPSAVTSVKNALAALNQQRLDLIVITRGGGSLEDLLAFNDETLARAVAASRAPTVCAIGHEGDIALCELVADLRASTPSNAAELVFPDSSTLFQDLDHLVDRLLASVDLQIDSYRHRSRQALSSLELNSNRLTHLQERLLGRLRFSLEQTHDHLNSSSVSCSHLINRLYTGAASSHTAATNLLSQLHIRLKDQDITTVLAKGYSLTHDSNGKLVTSLDQISLGQPLTTRVTDGTIQSTVNKKTKHP